MKNLFPFRYDNFFDEIFWGDKISFEWEKLALAKGLGQLYRSNSKQTHRHEENLRGACTLEALGGDARIAGDMRPVEHQLLARPCAKAEPAVPAGPAVCRA